MSDPLLILGISIFTALLGEGLTWLLVYRTEKYQKLKTEVDKQSKKCKFSLRSFCRLYGSFPSSFSNCCSSFHPIVLLVEKKKDTYGEISDKQQKKKLEREEEKLKTHNRDLSMVKMKSMFAIGITFTALLSMFNTM